MQRPGINRTAVLLPNLQNKSNPQAVYANTASENITPGSAPMAATRSDDDERPSEDGNSASENDNDQSDDGNLVSDPEDFVSDDDDRQSDTEDFVSDNDEARLVDGDWGRVRRRHIQQSAGPSVK